MIFLILSVLLTTFLFVFFKWVAIKNVPLVPVISFNYLSCVITGLIFEGRGISDVSSFSQYGWSLLLGMLFFGIFYLMGRSSSVSGVGITGAASKLSMILPLAFGAVYRGEKTHTGLIWSLILVIPAILLLTRRKNEKFKPETLIFPFIIFLGSGLIDIALSMLQMNLGKASPSSNIVVIFLGAFIASLPVMVQGGFRRANRSTVTYGILLGIPNYFSIFFMMLALGSGEFTSGEFFLINNTGVILLGFILAALLFGEKVTASRLAGLLIAIVSIYLALYGV